VIVSAVVGFYVAAALLVVALAMFALLERGRRAMPPVLAAD